MSRLRRLIESKFGTSEDDEFNNEYDLIEGKIKELFELYADEMPPFTFSSSVSSNSESEKAPSLQSSIYEEETPSPRRSNHSRSASNSSSLAARLSKKSAPNLLGKSFSVDSSGSNSFIAPSPTGSTRRVQLKNRSGGPELTRAESTIDKSTKFNFVSYSCLVVTFPLIESS